jgi:hypothetical protein
MKEGKTYTMKTKTLLEEIKNLNEWKKYHNHRVQDLILLKWQYSPNWSTDEHNPYHNLNHLFGEIDKLPPNSLRNARIPE